MSTIRSVTVRLHASVDRYIADVRRAGRETSTAFDGAAASIAQQNAELSGTTRRMGTYVRRADQLTTATDRLTASTTGLNTRLRDTDNALGVLGGSSTRGIGGLNTSLQRTDNQINTTSGRLGLLVEAITTLGPAAIPIGAMVVPAVSGLATSLGVAALAGGTAVLAFQGVGDALGALNEAALEPTADNVAKAQDALERLSPAAQTFVTHLRDLADEGKALRDTAAEGWFTGLDRGLTSVESLLPKLQSIIREVSSASGDIIGDGMESLTTERWAPFFDWIESTARPTLEKLGTAFGDTAHGIGSLLVASDDMSSSFLDTMVRGADAFDRWASSADAQQRINGLMEYLSDVGPQAGQTLLAVADALGSIVTAAAPLSGPVLSAIEAVANLVNSIADSPGGTALLGLAAGLIAVRKAAAGLQAVGLVGRGPGGAGGLSGMLLGPAFAGRMDSARTSMGRLRTDIGAMRAEYGRMGAAQAVVMSGLSNTTAAAQRTRASLGSYAATAGKAGAAAGGMALLMSGAADSMGVTNTVMLGMAGAMAGPWGAAIGAAVGGVMDLAAANDDLKASVEAANTAMDSGSFDQMAQAREQLAKSLKETTDNDVFGVDLPGRLGDIAGGYLNIVNPLSNVSKTMGFLTGDTEEATQKLSQLDGALAQGRNAAALDGIGTAMDALSGSANEAASASRVLNAALQQLLGPGLAVEEATDQWRASLKQLAAELNASAGFKGYSDAAMANREMTRSYVNDSIERLTALADAGTTTETKMARAVSATRQEFIKSGMAAGMSRKQIVARANALGLTPKLVKTTFKAAGVTEVTLKARELAANVRKLPKSVQTHIRTRGIPESSAQIQALARKYNLTPKQVQTLARLKDQASPAVQRVLAKMGVLDRKQSTSRANLNDGPFTGVFGGVMRMLSQVDGRTATPTANINNQASGPLSSIMGQLSSVDGRVATSTINIVTNHISNIIRRTVGWADGGINEGVTTYADGGTHRVNGFTFGGPMDRANAHPPHIAAAGAMRGFAEPETHGEAYIPFRPDARDRSIAIWEAVGDRLGVQFARFAYGDYLTAAGPRTQGRPQPGPPPVQRGPWRDRDGLHGHADRLGDSLKRLRREVDRSEKAVEKERAQRNRLQDKYNSLSSGIRDKFRTDIFAENDDIWGKGTNWKGSLRSDIREAREFVKLLNLLKARGLDGPAFEYLAQTGDVDLARQWANMSRRNLRTYERLYEIRQRASRRAGDTAGEIMYGKQLRESNVELRKLRNELRELRRDLRESEKRRDRNRDKRDNDRAKKTGKALSEALNGASARAARSF